MTSSTHHPALPATILRCLLILRKHPPIIIKRALPRRKRLHTQTPQPPNTQQRPNKMRLSKRNIKKHTIIPQNPMHLLIIIISTSLPSTTHASTHLCQIPRCVLQHVVGRGPRATVDHCIHGSFVECDIYCLGSEFGH